MKSIAVLFALFALAVAVPVAPGSRVDDFRLTTHNFETLVDHFRPQDGRVVNFTYTLNREFFQQNGPIFVFINDGGLVQNEYLLDGLVYDIARTTGGALATANHRYTGVNTPTEDASFENLAFLTVDQALGDLAALIATLQRDLSTHGRVIVWGTGYGGTLATFARKKFPHLIDGAFASSPLFRAEVIDNTYYDNLSMILRRHGGTECAERIDAAFFVLQLLLEIGETEYLTESLNLCTPLRADNEQEVAAVVYRLVNTISDYIRRNNLPGVENLCRDMRAHSADPFSSLLRWIDYAYGSGYPTCVSTYDVIIDSLNKTSWDELSAQTGVNRAQVYLQCTQLGGLKVTTDFDLDLFPEDLITEEYQYRFCEDVLGAQYDRQALAGAVDALNLNFGGQDQVISNVAFSNAALDPLIHHGIADYNVYESVAVFLENYSAGTDLKSLSGEDSVNLATAKRTITSFVERWATGPN